jgi:hypothetical protein
MSCVAPGVMDRRKDEPTLIPMTTKLLAFIGTTLGGAAGWAVGALAGTMTAFMFSVVGTTAGLYAAQRASRAIGA